MSPARRRLLSGVFLAHVLIAATAVAAETARYAGRPVADVLAELRNPDLDFLYSSELVPAGLEVIGEPESDDALAIAREILERHGLGLQEMRPGLYAVVPAATPDAAAASAGAASDRDPLSETTPLSEVVVSTSRYALAHSGAEGSVHIGGKMLSSLPVLGEDAIRAIGRLPGIARNGVSAQVSVRGGEAGEVLVLLDGFPLRQAFHLPGYQSVFGLVDPQLVRDAEIFTGGFPVRYGNRMAGVFDLQTIATSDEPHTALGLSVFNALAQHSGQLGPGGAGWLAAVRVGTLRPFLRALAHDAGEPEYADAYARAEYGDPARLRLSANMLWSRDELSISRKRLGETAQIDSRTRYLWLQADREWQNGVAGSLWFGHSTIDSIRDGRIDDAERALATVADRRSSEILEVRGRFVVPAGARHWLEGGFEWTEEDAEYRYAAQATYPAVVAALFGRDTSLSREAVLAPGRERLAIFVAHRWQLSDGLVSELGLRGQRTTSGGTKDEWLFDPRFNLRWDLSAATSLRAHWGRFQQTDEVHELKVEDGLTAFPEAQRSDHFIAGLDHSLPNDSVLRLEWFRKLQSDPRPHFENLLDPLSLVAEVAPDRVRVAPAAADIRGAELSLTSPEADFGWWASLAWSEAKDTLDGRRVPRSWDQSWAASAGIDWTHGPWRVAAVAGARRGWPATRVLGTRLGERNAARLPTRGYLDLRADYRRPLAVGRLAITVELTNAVNIGNDCCAELVARDDGAGGVAFETRKRDWLPLVPSVGVLWEF